MRITDSIKELNSNNLSYKSSLLPSDVSTGRVDYIKALLGLTPSEWNTDIYLCKHYLHHAVQCFIVCDFMRALYRASS
jgi:hypothetical protein